MGVICDMLESRASSTVRNPSQWFLDWIHGGSTSAAGVNVSPSSAMKYTPFWAGVRVIAGTLASLPMQVYKRLPDGGKSRVAGHKVYELLHVRPNEYMDAVTFIETRQAHVLTYGNGYAEIQRDGAGRPVALWPLLPDRTERKLTDDGVPYYEVTMEGGEKIPLSDYNVLHVKGLGFDGYTGYNVVQYHRDAIGYGVAVKEYGARFFSQDASPGGVLEHPSTLSDEAKKHLKESWGSGLTRSHRMQVLEEGLKWNQMGVEPSKAQALEVQKYTVDDCSRIFNVPPHKLGSMDRATFSNIEEQNIDFHTGTMLYWYRKWESECNYKLFTPAERKELFCEVLIEGMLRGNIKSRYEAYHIGRQAGFLCVDDIRGKENMNPLPDGKGQIFLEPLNMTPAGTSPAGTSVADDDKDDESKAIKQKLRDMIASHFQRVITKQGKTGYREDSKLWAIEILIDPVIAYGVASGQPDMRSIDALTVALSEYIRPTKQLCEADAGLFADRVCEILGVDHGKEN